MKRESICLKFRHDLPLRLEYALVNVHGFTFYARRTGEWSIYQKFIDPPKINNSDLPDDVVTELTRKVNKIASSFQDPDANKEVIRMRCTNLARTLLPKQRQWVMDWITRVIDEEDDATPWVEDEDGNFVAERGQC